MDIAVQKCSDEVKQRHLYEFPWNNSTSQTGKVSCHFEKVFHLLFSHGSRQTGRLFSYLKKFFFILQINGAGICPIY